MQGLDRWRGKVALVTGASSGIGAEIARQLAAEGLKVAVAARRLERIDKLCEEVAAQGGTAMAVTVDLRSEESILQAFRTVREAWGTVDVLVNNAGLGWQDPLAQGKTAEWREMAEVNLLALAICMREALTDMERNGEGQIVNISSMSAYRVAPGRNVAFYAATKHGVRALTDGMRQELVERDSPIKIGMVTPGLVETEFHAKAWRGEEHARKIYSRTTALQPADLAQAVLYMLSTPSHVQINDIILRPVAQAF